MTPRITDKDLGGIVRFQFRFDDAYRLAALPFGVRPDNSWVEVGERSLRASFGRWLVQTPLANITDVRVTGPYRFIRTAGPARLGVLERSLTFATNGDRGVCIAFAVPVWGFDRLGLIRHRTLTVTVEDPERLAYLLAGRADFAASIQALGG
jgi:hypothetical protein